MVNKYILDMVQSSLITQRMKRSSSMSCLDRALFGQDPLRQLWTEQFF